MIAAVGLLVSGCNKSNPVVPTDPTPEPPPGTTTYVVTIASDRPNVYTGASATPANLTITAKTSQGVNAPDGTSVNINTSLGNFGTASDGKPIQLVTRTLSGGKATLQFFGGDTAGTANILGQVGSSVGRLNLAVIEPPPAPVADFAFVVTGLSVRFTDTSTGVPATWSWNFDDCSLSPDTCTATTQHADHTYVQAGTYRVSLTVANSGGSSTKNAFVTVSPGTPPTADFTFATSGLQAFFTDTSTGSPTSWEWNFGDCDAQPSTCIDRTQNPSHTYMAAGRYSVSLRATNSAGSTSKAQWVEISLGAAPVADFTAAPDGLRVFFTDASTNTPTAWQWNFGDCSTNAANCIDTRQNPDHTYLAAGSYEVSLVASNAAGPSAEKKKFVTVSAGDPPKAAFEYLVNDLTVNFVDKSTGGPTSWAWTFGDCAALKCSSSAQNPIHKYDAAGVYTVTLTVTNAAGTNSTSSAIQVGAAPEASFTFTTNGLVASFTDTSTNHPIQWQWDFGDCDTNASCKSTSAKPTHTYLADGSYLVKLTVKNALGQSSAAQPVSVTSSP